MDLLMAWNRDALARTIHGYRSRIRVYNATRPPSRWRLIAQNAHAASVARQVRIARAQLDYIIAAHPPLVHWPPTHHHELTGETRDGPHHVPMTIYFAYRT
jgi:hypothetical protein